MSNTSAPARGEDYYKRTILIVSTIIITATYGIVYSFGVFLPHYEEAFNASSAAISGAYSLCIILYMILGIFAGWAIDHFSPRVIILPGGILLMLGFFLTSEVTAVWQIYGTYALIGIAMSPMYNPLMTTVSRWFTSKRGSALGILSTGIGVGPLLMAPFATYLISVVGWRHTLVIIGLVAGGIIITCALFLKKAPAKANLLHSNINSEDNSQLAVQTASKTFSASEGLTLKQAIHTRAFWLIAGMYLMIGFSVQMVLVHVVSYSLSRGLNAITAATILSTVSGSSTIGRTVMGIASDRIGRQKTLAICLFFEGAMIWWLAGATEPWMLFTFGVVFGFFYGGHVPTIPALVGDIMGLAHMGTVLSVCSSSWGIGGAIGPLLAGRIVDITGSYLFAFIIGGTCALTAAIISIFIKRPLVTS